MEDLLPAPEIRTIEKMVLVGASSKMSLVRNETVSLWKSFMPRIAEISARKNKEFLSLQIYDPSYFRQFDPSREFVKWAAVEVGGKVEVPDGLAELVVESGLYAVFHYKGMPGDPAAYQYIFSQWIPRSGYELDNRPHFEIMGERYKNNSLDSVEDIYIPIKPRM